ncbi:MAG: [FeFe] hydrogenase H-cluster radical SAM maturase HydE [Eubacteriales bacterium]|nr:[FeFe] hydrogenase H-cluster radical SAM maturase HydE [Eubacteriales bacterium]
MREIIEKLKLNKDVSDNELASLIDDNYDTELLFQAARSVREEIYGKKIYIRGLIEVSNYCKNDCFYCGIRKSNLTVNRFRLTKEEILSCCKTGYSLGFRTFVMQGGEDMHFTDDIICDILREVKSDYPDCAVTLSLGEKSYESYKAYFDAGADRYLLRHETANNSHYQKLHPSAMSLENRKECLYNLREIGYQVGSGFMVGSPYQTTENIIEDIRFLQDFNPHMVGIGPYMTHSQTPFANHPNGSVDKTLKLLAIIRLMFPKVLLPATTALGTALQEGREKGILAGANVIMPNLSPKDTRKLYEIYENKLYTGDEAAEALHNLKNSMKKIGYEIVVDRGDHNSKTPMK